MELGDFVSTTLQEIARGIIDASDCLRDTNTIVSPHDFRINSQESQALGRTKNPNTPLRPEDVGTRIVQKIEFDIAVTVDESDTASAGGKISVLSLGIGAGTETALKSGTNSRIKFSVPVVFPSNEIDN